MFTTLSAIDPMNSKSSISPESSASIKCLFFNFSFKYTTSCRHQPSLVSTTHTRTHMQTYFTQAFITRVLLDLRGLVHRANSCMFFSLARRDNLITACLNKSNCPETKSSHLLTNPTQQVNRTLRARIRTGPAHPTATLGRE